MKQPLVAIRTLVYNHAPYLHEYFKGILMQETNFPFIAVVHDDCSTDGSTLIIREYTKNNPTLFSPIFEDVNCYQNNMWNIAEKKIQHAYGNAKYIAYCEGDDYWTDPHKLQRQIDFLEKHPEYVAIAENGLIHNSVVNKEYPFNVAPSHDVSLEEVIVKRRFPTAGVLCRKDAFEGYYETIRVSVDTIMWCWLISKGKFRYENIISSVYRRGTQGITVYTDDFKFVKMVETWNLEILHNFDVKQEFIYKNIAQECLARTKHALKKFKFISAAKCALYYCKYQIKSLLVNSLPIKQ